MKTWYQEKVNYDASLEALVNGRYENVDKKSMTIPDRSMTVREIMDRYAKGLPMNPGQVKVPLYHGDSDELSGRDPRSYDLVEQKQIMEEKLAKIKQDIADQQEAQKVKRRQSQKEKDIAEYLAAKAAQENKEPEGDSTNTV